jgi:hypothetical protein
MPMAETQPTMTAELATITAKTAMAPLQQDERRAVLRELAEWLDWIDAVGAIPPPTHLSNKLVLTRESEDGGE